MNRNGSFKNAEEQFRNRTSLGQFIETYGDRFKTLTKRETQVLTLVANSTKNPAIAEQLGIATSTVYNYRTAIRRKLSITHKSDYIKYALAFGLIEF